MVRLEEGGREGGETALIELVISLLCLQVFPGRVHCVKFSPKGNVFASAGDKGKVIIPF